MEYVYHGKPSDKKGLISNTHGFLYRHLDTGFQTKWDGFWVPPYKFLDYFSFQVNGIYLNSDTLNGVEYGEKMVFHHNTDTMEIAEKIIAPDGFPGIKVELEIINTSETRKALQTVLEAGIDIRSKDIDVETEAYDIERNSGRIIASRKGKKLVIEPEDVSDFRGERYDKEHFPEEKQVCKIPEKPVFRKEIGAGETVTVKIEFKTSEGVFQELESPENDLEHELGRSFNSCLGSLENLIYSRNGTGIIAGHPWFQSYWARDSFWSLLGLIDGGYFETSRKILENFAERDLDGRIGLEDNDEEEKRRSDTAPLFIIAADKLRRHDAINEKIEDAMEAGMQKLEMDGNIVEHDPEGTWMDTLERDKAVDIQSLWLEAAGIMNDENERDLRKGLGKFNEEGLLKDELEGGSETINPAVPLMLGQLEKGESEKELERINGEFSSRYGARTISMADPGYDSSGYHTGSVWGLTTCWAAAANFEYGNDKQGVSFLKKLEQFLDRDQPGALPELMDAESGEILGASEQAWSAGLLVHVIDTYMLGIKVKDDHVEINPADVTATRKGKKIRGEELDLKVLNGEVEVLNNPDLDLRF